MSIPSVEINVRDGALGQLPESAEGIPCLIGVSSQGPLGQLLTFTSVDAVAETLGVGPLAESVAFVLAHSGGPVRCVRVESTVPGVVGPVTRTDPTSPEPLAGGQPRDNYSVVVRITRDGAPGEAAFRFSLDGGRNFSREFLVDPDGPMQLGDSGCSFVIPFIEDGEDGPTLLYGVGDEFTFSTRAPRYDLEDLATAFDAALASSLPWEFVYVVGALPAEIQPEDLTALVALADTKMSEAQSSHRYAFTVLELLIGTDPTLPAILDQLLFNVASNRVMIAPSSVEAVSPLSGRVYSRSVALPVVQRLAAIPIGEDPARVRAGALPGVVSIQWDEATRGGLDDIRLTTLRTHIGRPGFYVTNGRMLAAEGSDFNLVQRRRVMDRACAVAYDTLLDYLNESVRVDADTGFILEADAAAIDGVVRSALDAAIVNAGQASSASARVRRDDNVLSTNTLRTKIRVVPLAYAKTIEADIGFENSAIQTA